MDLLTTVAPTAAAFMRLGPRGVAGLVLTLMNAASEQRNHPRNLRLAAEAQYPGQSARAAGDLMAEAVELLFGERFIARDYRDNSDNDWFRLTEKGAAVISLGDIDSPALLMDSGRPLVFVSCGQCTDEEKAIAAKVCELIREHTEYEPYFAQNQQSFEGLSHSILAALERMSGMVVIMHKRGKVSTPSGAHHRASVWIEQEIAIAAMIQHRGKPLIVAAYIEDGIHREGLRDLLHLNPVTFRKSSEIIAHFERLVREKRFPLQPYTTPVSASSPMAKAVPSEAEVLETLDDAYENLMVFSFVCSMSVAVQPTTLVSDRIPDSRMRQLIEDARHQSGGGFPLGPTGAAANLNDGFEVTIYPNADGPRQYREYYRFRHNGLFVATQVSPDDIREDRQYRESDRYIGFTTLVGTLTRMASFAAAMTKLLNTETKTTVFVSGLAHHRLIDDTVAKTLPPLDQAKPAHESRVVEEFVANPSPSLAQHRDWAARVIARCLRLLNYPATEEYIENTVKSFQRQVL